MPRRMNETLDIWRQMKPPTLRLFALAAFLLFGVLGLLSILMQSAIRVFPWTFVAMQTVAAGGLAASIVLTAGRRWWVTVLIVAFWTGVMFVNGGGLSFVVTDGQFSVRLEGPLRDADDHSLLHPQLTPSDLQAVYIQRGIVGGLALILLVLGYTTVVVVIRGEVGRRARLETEVLIAQDIQRSLIPAESLSAASCTISGMTVPTSEVAGDYHDFLLLPDGRVVVAIADVTGHGVGAGILSAMTKSAFHTQLEHDAAPVAVLASLNRTLYELSDDKTFVTFACACIDSTGRSVDIATAGHPPVLHRDRASRDVRAIRSRNPALAMRRDTAFDAAARVACGPGDLFLFYTDGILEASNEEGEEFGEDRLKGIFSTAEGSPQDILSSVLSALERFTGRKGGFGDDISAVCIRMM